MTTTIVTLRRFLYHEWGTFGELSVNDYTCYTLERPWLDNRANVSCIPAGVYMIHLGNFRGKYPNYELDKVPNRTAIEMHIGNTISDSLGCILLGSNWAISSLDQDAKVINSRDTFNRFMAAMHGARYAVLNIIENTVQTSHKWR